MLSTVISRAMFQQVVMPINLASVQAGPPYCLGVNQHGIYYKWRTISTIINKHVETASSTLRFSVKSVWSTLALGHGVGYFMAAACGDVPNVSVAVEAINMNKHVETISASCASSSQRAGLSTHSGATRPLRVLVDYAVAGFHIGFSTHLVLVQILTRACCVICQSNEIELHGVGMPGLFKRTPHKLQGS